VRVFQEAISFRSLEKGGSTSLVRSFLHSRKAADLPAGIPKSFLRASLTLLHVKKRFYCPFDEPCAFAVAPFTLATPQESARFVTSARTICVECANTFLPRIAAQ